MTSISKRHSKAVLLAVLLFNACLADDARIDVGGHVKARSIAQSFPGDSIFHDLTGSYALDAESDLRLDLDIDRGRWSLNAAYQLFGLYGERVEYARNLPDSGVFLSRFPEDERRLVDLTGVIDDDDKFAALHRLDRLWIGHATAKTVIRLGRQAISWGNGLFFTPMDIVNPFDPAAVDTEYKTGDDMLYLQFLRDNGDDLQGALVLRRDPASGDIEGDVATAAVKYHGVTGEAEYDVLVAVNHDDTMLGIGGNRNLGGAVVRADVVLTEPSADTTLQLVTNLSYSWTWGGRNMSGALEYFFNGFGQEEGDYELRNLAKNSPLLARLSRGELYSIGRHYLAGSVTIEMTPLWLLTPSVFLNLADGSALVQLVTQNNLQQNLSFLGSVNIPAGPIGTEYGGIATGTSGRYISTDLSIFAQIAWYF